MCLARFGDIGRREERGHTDVTCHLPGQFAEISILGAGEFPIGIASSPTEKGHLLFTVKRTGVATTNLHGSEVGRNIGVRGPLGKPFPVKMMEDKNVVIVGGGFAFTTLRAAIKYFLDENNRRRFGTITAIYGARSPGELIYKKELYHLCQLVLLELLHHRINLIFVQAGEEP